MILGLAGFTIAAQRAEHLFTMPHIIPQVLQLFSLAIFSILLITYFVKIIKYPKAVLQEFKHPVKLAFFPTISISFLLLSTSFLGHYVVFSKYLWVIGTVLHLLFTFKVISTWMHDSKFEIKHMSPAWFIPAVGNIIVPLAGIEHAPQEISWFFFSIGIVFWIILLVIFFNRIIFHHPLPEKLAPTLFILIAPPVIGFVAYTKLTGGISEFGMILYYIGLFFTFLLLSQIRMFSKLRFFLSWWAYSFPMAAITIASTLMYHSTQVEGFKFLAIAFFIILVALISVLLIRTGIAILNKEICIEEKE